MQRSIIQNIMHMATALYPKRFSPLSSSPGGSIISVVVVIVVVVRDQRKRTSAPLYGQNRVANRAGSQREQQTPATRAMLMVKANSMAVCNRSPQWKQIGNPVTVIRVPSSRSFVAVVMRIRPSSVRSVLCLQPPIQWPCPDMRQRRSHYRLSQR